MNFNHYFQAPVTVTSSDTDSSSESSSEEDVKPTKSKTVLKATVAKKKVSSQCVLICETFPFLFTIPTDVSTTGQLKVCDQSAVHSDTFSS